jgi:hypothetical protein
MNTATPSIPKSYSRSAWASMKKPSKPSSSGNSNPHTKAATRPHHAQIYIDFRVL